MTQQQQQQQPPPQYILPPHNSLPLIPVRPTVPNNEATSQMNRRNSEGSINGQSPNNTRRCSENNNDGLLPITSDILLSPYNKQNSDCENIMSRSNTPPPPPRTTQLSSNNNNRVSQIVNEALTKARSCELGNDTTTNNNMGEGAAHLINVRGEEEAAPQIIVSSRTISMTKDEFQSIILQENENDEMHDKLGEDEENDMNNLGEENDLIKNNDREIRIGETGNPIGSLGYLWDSVATQKEMQTVVNDDSEESNNNVEASQHIQIANDEEEDDNNVISSSKRSLISTSHYPLEISTDNGGVSALLPSGQVLVDEISTAANANEDDNDFALDVQNAPKNQNKFLAEDVTDKLNRILNNEDGEEQQQQQQQKAIIDTEGGDDDLHDEKRCSDTADNSPKSDTREEPLSSEDYSPSNDVRKVSPVGEELEGVSGSGSGSGTMSRSSTPLHQIQTASSSISEDPTFNSYAPSELSSMMSHMEIQNLLKQGRQQQHDMMANHNTTICRPPSEIIGGTRGGGREAAKATMTLYTNQSLYSPRKGEGGDDEQGRRRPIESTSASIPQSISQQSSFPQIIQSTPSSTSHLLHRADAMDGSVMSNNNDDYNTTGPNSQGLYPQGHPQHQQQQYHDSNLNGQNDSMLVSNPSISSSITSVNNYTMYPRGGGGIVGGVVGGEDESSLGGFQELQHSTPLYSPSVASMSMMTENSAVVNNSEGLKVDFHVGSNNDNDYDEAVESVLDDQATITTASQHESIGGGESYRTMSSTEKKSVQSLLGTSTKSLADDLAPHSSDDDSDTDRKPTGSNTSQDRSKQFPQQSVLPSSEAGDDIDGYTADRSTSPYNLMAHDISEYSTSANSYSMELRKALPMSGMSEDDTENSHNMQQHYGGYGHTYDQQPPMMEYTKPVIPASFPSLMDQSVSSALTELTGMTSPTVAPLVVSAGVKRRDCSQQEEREDSLPYISNTNPRGSTNDAPTASQRAVVHHIDPLMATTSSTTMSSDNDYSNQPLVMMHHHAPAQAHSSDPRMNIEYERHYIVDLEQIVEESSNNDMRSGGTSTASSPRRAATALSNEGGAATRANFQSIPEGSNQQQQHLNQPQMLNHHPKHPKEFFDYRHQYYTEQYHYFDDKQASNSNRGGDNGNDDDESNCSSVTLSQAFQQSDGNDSCASSMSDEYSSSHMGSSYVGSTVSSVTLSRALSVEKHDHGQGFYVATRLGDFVEVPVGGADDVSNVGDEVPFPPPAFKTEEVYERKESTGDFTVDSLSDTKSDMKSGTHTDEGDSSTNKSSGTEDGVTAVSDLTAVAVKNEDDVNEKSSTTQLGATAEDIESDIIAALVPECGVPIPSVMAKAGTARARSSSKGGMLLPWHSTRSIQNYQGRRGSKKKSAPLYSSRSREGSTGSIFSIGSVHTFRG